MNMRKIIVLSLIAGMILFSGCSGIYNTPAPVITEPPATATPVPTPAPTPIPTPTPTVAPTPTPTPAPTVDPLIEQAKGMFNGDEYTNDLFGMTMTKDKSYVEAPMDQVEKQMQPMSNTLESVGTKAYFSFMLISSSAKTSSNGGAILLMSAKLNDKLPGNAQDFMKAAFGKVTTVKINGTSLVKSDMSISTGKINLKLTYYCVYRNGYMLLFIMTSTDKADAKALTAMMNTVKFK